MEKNIGQTLTKQINSLPEIEKNQLGHAADRESQILFHLRKMRIRAACSRRENERDLLYEPVGGNGVHSEPRCQNNAQLRYS